MKNKKLRINKENFYTEERIKIFKNNLKYIKSRDFNAPTHELRLEEIKFFSYQEEREFYLFDRYLKLIKTEYDNIQFEIQWDGKIVIYNNNLNKTVEFDNILKLSEFLDQYDSVEYINSEETW